MADRKEIISLHEQLLLAIQSETKQFEETYLWLEKSMPSFFFEKITSNELTSIAHCLVSLRSQDYFSAIHVKNRAIVLCLDSPEADLKILKNYPLLGIISYQSFTSLNPLPSSNNSIIDKLKIVLINFSEAIESIDIPFPEESKEKLLQILIQNSQSLDKEQFELELSGIHNIFLCSLEPDKLAIALNLFSQAQDQDACQYKVIEETKNNQKSLQVLMAWKNCPKHYFLYNLEKIIHRYGLNLEAAYLSYVEPYTNKNTLLLNLKLNGFETKSADKQYKTSEFLKELTTAKYFNQLDRIDSVLVDKQIINGSMGNLLRAITIFIHQGLTHLDSNLYTIENIEEGLCRHPELTRLICEAFRYKFDPKTCDFQKFEEIKKTFLKEHSNLDTGNETNDIRRKNILYQAMNFVIHTYKTNFYCPNITALSFRLNPQYLREIPYDLSKKFPEIPFGIFFIKGMHFFGYHIRFKDLSRGGLRTVSPEQQELIVSEQNNVFSECYNLAFTQHKKNKDIPEGGAKGIIFLNLDTLDNEIEILEQELKNSGIEAKNIAETKNKFRQEQKLEHLYQSQRAFIENLITLINCESNGQLKTKEVIDYWKRPEYIYLGPDENMHDRMIRWIAQFSKDCGYKPGSCFISGKPDTGINHKEYGVTSLGVNVYVEEVLKYLGIDPRKDVFTVKMSGGPDGDVAGNEICTLHKYYPNTAKLLCLTDGSGTIYDPLGVDLKTLVKLFYEAKAIKHYPPEKLSRGSFLVDKNAKRELTPYVRQTLCWRNIEGKIVEDWLSENEMYHLLRTNVHKTKADLFIPAGGRPRTLNDHNYEEYLDDLGEPTSKAIVEGANLYLTAGAERALEKLGVLIIKDSSANKAGVICSSFEVLCGLALGDDGFLKNKKILIQEILKRLNICALNEANLLLTTLEERGGIANKAYLTEISDQISAKINAFTYEILDYLDTISPFPNDPSNPYIHFFLDYCLPVLRDQYKEQLLREIPENHKKAIIACHIAAQLVYMRGLSWSPSIVDILPLLK